MFEDIARRLNQLERAMRDIRTADRPGGVYCLAYSSVVQPVATSASLAWDHVHLDTARIWSVTYPTRLYAPLDGLYLAGGSWQMSTTEINATDKRLAMFINHLNAAGVSQETYAGQVHPTVSGQDSRMSASAPVYMLRGEYIEIVMSHNFGVSKNITAATSTSFAANSGWLTKIG